MLLGSLGGLSKRQSQDVLRQAGARVVETHHPSVQTIVLGHDHPGLETLFGNEPNLRQEIETGHVVALGERELWQWLDYFNDSDANSQHYTPAMLAELLAVPVRTVRRWCQAGLIHQPKRCTTFHCSTTPIDNRSATGQVVQRGPHGSVHKASIEWVSRIVFGRGTTASGIGHHIGGQDAFAAVGSIAAGGERTASIYLR